MVANNSLLVVNLGIDTHQEPVVYLREDCHVCRSEGFNASTRVLLECNGKTMIATVNTLQGDLLAINEIGFSLMALKQLQVENGDCVSVKHAPIVDSLSFVRKKIYGGELSQSELLAIISDITAHRYSDIDIASFLSVSAGQRLSLNEILALTKAMVACGKRIDWGTGDCIYDKHCIGGLPGNRTTPIVVAIVSAAGLPMPKTSSRAITSPAGTADTMETLTHVNLSLDQIKRVVSQTGACLAWGGAAELSPADDVLIRIERALDIDGEGQLIASVLSKKIAAGSTHVLIDIPVGETAKVRTQAEAQRLQGLFVDVGSALGIHVRVIITDGTKPVGRGIGPAEEAQDVLDVLNNHPQAPKDLTKRAIALSAQLIDMSNQNGLEKNQKLAEEILTSGMALQQFYRILEAQGGVKKIPQALYKDMIIAEKTGVLVKIDNRRLARLAKLAGAPAEPSAGLRLMANVGDVVVKGEPICALLSCSSGERAYALAYYADNKMMFAIKE